MPHSHRQAVVSIRTPVVTKKAAAQCLINARSSKSGRFVLIVVQSHTPTIDGTIFSALYRDAILNQTTLKQRPGRDHRPSTGQETLEGISTTDRESCHSVQDTGRDTAISQ